jgi:hypothetical protein
MGKDKKPDLAVWSEEKGYYAKTLTYGTDLGAPVIKMDNVGGWKQAQVEKINKVFTKKFNEIKNEFQELIDEVNWNEFVYLANCSFIPVIGETYYLYEKNDGSVFLSLIKPNEWNIKYVGAARLESDNKWVRVK